MPYLIKVGVGPVEYRAEVARLPVVKFRPWLRWFRFVSLKGDVLLVRKKNVQAFVIERTD